MIRYPFILFQNLGIFEKLSLYIMPIHYYYPSPDLDVIRRDPRWDLRPKEIAGIDLNEDYQLKLLQLEFPKYVNEYDFPLEKKDIGKTNAFYFNNHMFANTDAEVYYCMIRTFKPNIIIEVGGGRSTQICLTASEKNYEIYKIEKQIFVIEPYPNRKILIPMTKGSITLIESKVEEIDLDFFQQLHKNDILFIDSSHVIRSGGDVNYLILEVLPILNPGVLVHIHDIRLPYEISKRDILKGTFFTEQYLLQAFLIGNENYEILWGTNFMSEKFETDVGKVFRSSFGGKYIGGSFWIRRKDK